MLVLAPGAGEAPGPGQLVPARREGDTMAIFTVSAAASPDKPALIAVDREDPTRVVQRITYAELVAHVRAAANR